MANKKTEERESAGMYQQVYRSDEFSSDKQPQNTERPKKMEVEKHDLPAMMCSAYLIFIPVCAAALTAIGLLAYFFFAR